MPDRYLRLAGSAPGRAVLRRAQLPVPVPLARHRPGAPLSDGPILLLGATDDGLATVVRCLDVDVHIDAAPPDGCAAIILDARRLCSSTELAAVPELLSPVLRSLRASGRVLVAGIPPESAGTTSAAVAQRALEGVVRSLGKELRDGATCNLLQVEPSAETAAESTLRFLLSARSAYVSGQVVRVEATPAVPVDWHRPHDSAVALVTGAANGIGAAIAVVLARDGAHVVCVDTPAQAEALRTIAANIGGHPLAVDLTDPQAPDVIAAQLRQAHGGVDVVVHNAGITRDRTLARMDAEQWASVLDINLAAVERLTETLLDDDLLRDGGAIVASSSINGIAGNRGQTNYAASKAGVIGLVEALAPGLRGTGRRINAVAPGFIETRLTARMPAVTREVARRLNSLGQGGRPVDVAETVAWLAAPATAGVNGQTIRVCGQALLGA